MAENQARAAFTVESIVVVEDMGTEWDVRGNVGSSSSMMERNVVEMD